MVHNINEKNVLVATMQFNIINNSYYYKLLSNHYGA